MMHPKNASTNSKPSVVKNDRDGSGLRERAETSGDGSTSLAEFAEGNGIVHFTRGVEMEESCLVAALIRG